MSFGEWLPALSAFAVLWAQRLHQQGSDIPPQQADPVGLSLGHLSGLGSHVGPPGLAARTWLEWMFQGWRTNVGHLRDRLSQAQAPQAVLLQRHRGRALPGHGQRVPQLRVWSQVLLSELKDHLLMLHNLRPPVVPRTLPTSRKVRVYLSSIYSYIQVLSVL